MPETWDYETDVLVIGYGGAGLWAGITAFDEGAQVLYLEKSPFRGGGSSSINMGQWTAPHDADAAAQFAFEAFMGRHLWRSARPGPRKPVQTPTTPDEYGLEYTLGDSPRAEYNIFTGYEEMYVGSGDGYGAGLLRGHGPTSRRPRHRGAVRMPRRGAPSRTPSPRRSSAATPSWEPTRPPRP